MKSAAHSHQLARQLGKRFQFCCLFFLLAIMTIGWLGCDRSSPSSPSPNADAKSGVSGTVELMVNFRDQDDMMVYVPLSADATVLSVLEQAQVEGALTFESRGQGESAFLKSINGVENEGAGGDNWVYRVNGQLGDRSFGVYKVEADDQILWSFGKYQPDQE